jgi:hypothetical protein
LHNVVGSRSRQALPQRQRRQLRLLGQLDGWIGELDRGLAREASQRAEAQRLMTHPGVGPLTALATTLILGPVERFAGYKQVASYAGIIPAEYSSGGRQQFGKLTKQGDPLLRFLLVEAAQSAARYDPELQRTNPITHSFADGATMRLLPWLRQRIPPVKKCSWPRRAGGGRRSSEPPSRSCSSWCRSCSGAERGSGGRSPTKS